MQAKFLVVSSFFCLLQQSPKVISSLTPFLGGSVDTEASPLWFYVMALKARAEGP